MLEREFRYYLHHQTELAKDHDGQVLVIKGEQVIGVYSDEGEAIREASKDHELGTFLVQRCSPDPGSVTLTYHSRIAAPVG